MRALHEVRRDSLVHGKSDSSLSCLRLAGGFIRSNRCYAEGARRVILGRPLAESVTIIQSKGGECYDPFKSEDYPHIARNEFT